MNWLEVLASISTGLIDSILIFLFFCFRNYLVTKICVLYHFLTVMLLRKSYVLIWNDDDIAHSRKISKILEKGNSSLLFRALKTPKEILRFLSNPFVVRAVILIDSDVTKLSEDIKIKEKIQNWLMRHLDKGGGIIGTHDLIYRRVRNEKLEKAFGCKLTDFIRTERKVKYVRNPDIRDHLLLKDLSESFELDDGETCWGDWCPDVTYLFLGEGEDPKPLVVSREYSRGKVVWLNSGDKKDYIAVSISLPQEEFIILLRNAIDWVSKTE